MTQYISKDALVAEIKRRLWLLEPKMTFHQQRVELEKLLSFIDTLELKEVDLDKEVDNVMKRFLGNITCREEQLKFAKHFFELGLNAQCKISYVPNIDDSLEELGVDPTSKEAKIFKESYYIALEKLKAQKGE